MTSVPYRLFTSDVSQSASLACGNVYIIFWVALSLAACVTGEVPVWSLEARLSAYVSHVPND